MKFSLNFRQQSHLTSSSFEKEKDIVNLKDPPGATTIYLHFDSEIIPHSPNFTTGDQKFPKFGLNLPEALYFQNEATYLIYETNSGSADDSSMSSPNLLQFAPPSLRKCRPLK